MMPKATARLQLHADYPLTHAVEDLPYYAHLGVSHLYLSPISTARAGSTHGYDVTDPARVNPELGGEAALIALARCAREHGMGLILDIVPNHMAAHPDNLWWRSVLQNGVNSAFASWFDICWWPSQAWLRGRILLPILGEPFDHAMRNGDVRLHFDAVNRCFVIMASGLNLPLAPGSLDMSAWPDVANALAAHDPATGSGQKKLIALLEAQHYRLAWWRSAAEHINWRRFFEISDLVGVRVEEQAVFDAVHALPLRLFEAGLIDGLRIDHVDGMAQPLAYCATLSDALRTRAPHRPVEAQRFQPWLIVEKILADGETLDARWKVHGDTGYAFMDAVSAVLHDPAGEPALTSQWRVQAGDARPASDWLWEARAEMVARHFVAERNRLLDDLLIVANSFLPSADADLLRSDLGDALDALLIAFPVYRIYASPHQTAPADHEFLAQARDAAHRALEKNGSHAACLLDKLVQWLGGESAECSNAAATPGGGAGEDTGADADISADIRADAGADDAARNAIRDKLAAVMTRFQQLTPPLAAKAQEDTLFYRYGRLLSRNEVGSDPAIFAWTPQAFHDWNDQRAKSSPFAMLATATHDHKRGEDARARLAVLSQAGQDWRAFSTKCMAAMQSLLSICRDAESAYRYMMLQTIVGAWPPLLAADDSAGLQDFFERMEQWQVKALREGKVLSSWFSPDSAIEDSLRTLLAFVLIDDEGAALRERIEAFVRHIAPAGVVNSLASVVLRCTAPGVPDLYQGTDLWDFSLVDPDNRRPVDMGLRKRLLQEQCKELAGDLSPLLRDWRSGAIKQAVILRCLGLRQDMPELFAQGDYSAVQTTGSRKGNVLAFVRRLEGDAVIVVVSRCIHDAMHSSYCGDLPLAPQDYWHDTELQLAVAGTSGRWRDVLTGDAHGGGQAAMGVGAILGKLPVAVLISDRRQDIADKTLLTGH